jgi:hypothetical protein
MFVTLPHSRPTRAGKHGKVLIPLLPVYNHRLGIGYITALLRQAGHEVILLDFEHILRVVDPKLAIGVQEETEVYSDQLSDQIQFLHRPELLFGALHEEDAILETALEDRDWRLIKALEPHIRKWTEAAADAQPDVVLFPTLVSNLWIALWASHELRLLLPSVPRIFGGRGVVYAEVQELILRAGWSEAICAGEAENSIPELVNQLTSGVRITDVTAPGIARLTGERIVNTPPPPAADLNTLPFPDYHGLPFPGAKLRHYRDWGLDFHDAASLAGSRWCPRRCAYCYESIYPKNYRLRPVDSVTREIVWQQDALETCDLFFCDSTLNVSERWLSELAHQMAALQNRPRVIFAHCEPRHLQRSTLERMRAAGFEKLNFGVESLDERTLQRMDRATTVEETQSTLVGVVEAGICLGLNFVANFPGEGLDEFRSTLSRARAFAERLRRAACPSGATVRYMVSQARIDPHSSLFVNHARFGVRLVRRPIPVPHALAHLSPVIERIAWSWEDGLPKIERSSRFSLWRQYLEALSIPESRAASTPKPHTRVALTTDLAPRSIQALLSSSSARLAGAAP